MTENQNPKIEDENPKIDRNPKIDWFVWALSIFCIFYLATRPRPDEALPDLDGDDW